MDIYHGAQTTYQVGYHIVWGVKYHKHLLNNTMKSFIADLIPKICDSYDYHYICIGIAPNHVHLFAGAPPKIAPAKIAQVIKSISARELYKEFPQLRRQLYGGEIWKDGYYIGTIGEGQTESTIKQYISKQGKHKPKEMKQLKLFFR